MPDIKLLPGEEIIWEARVSKVAYIYAIAMFLAVMAMRNLGTLASTRLTITNKRVVGKRGMLLSKAIDVPYDQIVTVRASRGLFGAIFDYGTITIITRNDQRFVCKAISEPLYVQMLIEEAVEIAVLGHKISDFVGDTHV